ncbi:DUF1778 domain-containing protein [Salmonella enterica]|nr:DUF1778 domain-containing protein [Salmonella enterica]
MTTITATIRATPEQLAVIDAAAAQAGVSRSAFIVAAATAAAHNGEHTPNTPAAFASELAELRQRIEALEQRQPQPAPRMYNGILRGEAVAAPEPAATPAPAVTPPPAAPATTPRRRLDTNPAAMAIIMERYAQGIAPAAVADELNAAGYTTGGGKPWDKASVSETGYRARRAAAKAKGKGTAD